MSTLMLIALLACTTLFGGPCDTLRSRATALPQEKTVVCIGDSLTSGNVPNYPDPNPWPYYLQLRLDDSFDRWSVVNLGVTSTMLLDESSIPYRATGNIEVAKELAPDVALVMLGTNDTFDPSWNPDAYSYELEALVDDLKSARSDMRVVLMVPCHVFCDPNPQGSGVFHMNDELIGTEIRPRIYDVAEATNSQVVDLYALTEGHPEWFPDTVHPNTEANMAIADYVYEQVF